MHYKLALAVALIVSTVGLASGAEKKVVKKPSTVKQGVSEGKKRVPVLKQGAFAAQLITALQWDKGLPAKPAEKDYLAILGGRRSFTFEAEDIYNPRTDNVPVRTYGIYGPFTGRGWLSGIAVPATAHFTIFLPLAGDYTLTAVVKGAGQTWTVQGKTFTVSGGGSFVPAEIGTVSLSAGEHEITVVLPPESGVDSVSLNAANVPPVQPLAGWHFDAPLKRSDAAEVAVALLGLNDSFPILPDTPPVSIAVADAITFPPTVSPATAAYYGPFFSKSWVRAGYRPVIVEIPVTVGEAGLYGVKVNYLGNNFSGSLDDMKVTKKASPSFSWVDLGVRYLTSGTHKLKVDLGPSEGIDVVKLEKRKSAPQDFVNVAGLQGEPGAELKEAEKKELIKSLVDRLKARE